MPEIKNTFTDGRMNKDLDERLISKTEYRDALNIELSTSQDGNVGAVQNSWGNTKFSEVSELITNATCVGSVVDKENDKLYWFIAGDEADAIAEYDYKTEQVIPVLVDSSIKETNTIIFSGSETIGDEIVSHPTFEGITQTTKGYGAEGWYTDDDWSISSNAATFNGTGADYLGLMINAKLATHYRVSITYKHLSGDHLLYVGIGDTSAGWMGSSKTLDTDGGDSTVQWEDLGGGKEKQTFYLTTDDLNILWTGNDFRIYPGTNGVRWNGIIYEVSIKEITYPEHFTFWDNHLHLWTNNTTNDGADLSQRAWTIADGVLTANEFTSGFVTYKPTAEPFFQFIEGEEYEMTYEIITPTPGGIGEDGGLVNADDFLLANATNRGENVRLNPYTEGVKTVKWVQGPVNLDQVVFYHTIGNKFSVDNISFKKVNRFLNFESNKLITGINILDGMLFWTDGENEPKKINIERCKSGSFSIINGDTSIFLGDELVRNGSFTDNADDWVLAASCSTGVQDASSAPQVYWTNNAINWKNGHQTSWISIFQREIEILRGEQYEVSFTIKNHQSGKVQAFIVDQNGTPTTGSSRNSDGTFTQILTAGLEQNEIWNYTPKSIGIRLYNRHIYGNFIGTIDDFSVRKVQTTWKSTTQARTPLGEFKGDIKEPDITVIKRYPLDAPGMELRNSSKGPNAVIKTNCTTPLNTSWSGTEYHWGASNGDLPFHYIYSTLANRGGGENVLNMYKVKNATYAEQLQIDLNDMFYTSTGTGVNSFTWHDDDPTFNLATAVTNNKAPWWTSGSIDSIHDDVMKSAVVHTVEQEENNGQFETPFATESGYLERAWKEWLAVNWHSHMWFQKKDGSQGHIGWSSIVDSKDLIGGRIWLGDRATTTLDSTTANSTTQQYNGQTDLLEAGDKVSFGKWFGPYNNLTFWTYKDGDGNERVKPPGVSNTPMILPDGTKFRDEVGNTYGSPTVPRAEDNYLSSPGHFGSGWSAVGDTYVGTAATTTANAGGLYSIPVDQNGHQYVQLVADDLQKNRPYTISFKVVVTVESGNTSASDVGISAHDHNGVVVDTSLSSTHFRLENDQGVGTYFFNRNFTADNDGGIQFFKRNGVECVISEISIVSMYANPVVIQPLHFSPRPDYNVGDIIELTNTTKDSKGEPIKIRVRLKDERDDDHGKMLSLPYHGPEADGGVSNKWWSTFGHGRTTVGMSTPINFKNAWKGVKSNGERRDFQNDSDFSENSGIYHTVTGTLAANDGLKDTNGGHARFQKTQASNALNLRYGIDSTDGAAQIAAGAGPDGNYPTYVNSNSQNISSNIPEGTPAGQLFTEGEWYMMKYQVSNTTLTNSSYLRIYNGGQTDTSGNLINGGKIYIPRQDGIHTVVWQQGPNYLDKLIITCSTSWQGRIDNWEMCQIKPELSSRGGVASNQDRKIFDCEIVSIDQTLLELSNIEKCNWTCLLYDRDPLFETRFPRFAYRWKYEDGEYSAISPFTQVAFLPGDTYEYDSKKAYNLAMTNHVRRVILKDFQKPPRGVKELDILFKESHNTNIYTVTTIKGQELEDFEKYEITQEQLHAVVESKQLLRPYDNVPRKAKAQEISANRLIYGNYTQQYTIPADEEPVIYSELSSSYITPGSWAPTIKSLRNYQIGLSYVDQYGRQSPVFSSKNSLIDVPLDNASTANELQAKTTNFPPDWATHYKWYVKDASQEYYNIALDRFYQGEYDDHTWLSFPSSDFNKLQEDDYLILKKQHNKNDIIVDTSKVLKYKVIKKQGGSPDFLRISRDRIGGRIKDTTGAGLHFFSQASYGGSAAGYPLVGKTTFRIKGNVVEGQGDASGGNPFKTALLDSQSGKYVRIGKENSAGTNSFSNYYEVLHVTRTNTNDSDYEDAEDYYEFTLVKPLDVDASFVGSGYSSTRNLFLEYYGEGFNRFEGNFEGKFFVKILKDSEFDNNIAAQQTSTDASYNIVNAADTYWQMMWELAPNASLNVGNNDRNDVAEDTDIWLLDRNNYDWGTTTYSRTDGTAYTLSGTGKGKYNGVDVDMGYPANYFGTCQFDSSAAGWDYVMVNPMMMCDWSAGVPTNFDGQNGGGAPSNWHRHVQGCYDSADYEYSPKSTQGQYLAIDQTWAWHWSETDEHYEGQDTDAENARLGSGFVRGNNYCTFRITNFGEFEANDAADRSDDINTWEESGFEMSPQYVENYELYKQLTRVGTHFRWSDDPSQTVYTITKVRHNKPVANYGSWDPAIAQHLPIADISSAYISHVDKVKKPENFGYRIQLELNRNIVWSPTSTIASGQLFNEDGSHSPIVSKTSGTIGTSSKLEILEFKPSEITYTSESPAVFEIEPKERADLNLYYESSNTNMVLKTGMFIEALNNADVNDGGSAGGNYNSIDDIGTIYKPGGVYALPYAYTGGAYDLNTPLCTIMTGAEWFGQNNKLYLNPYTFSNPVHTMPGEFLLDPEFNRQSVYEGNVGHYWDLHAANSWNIWSTSGEASVNSTDLWDDSGTLPTSKYIYGSAGGSMFGVPNEPILRFATYRVTYKVSNWVTGTHRIVLLTPSKHYGVTTLKAGNGTFEEDVRIDDASGGAQANRIMVQPYYADLVSDSDMSNVPQSNYWHGTGSPGSGSGDTTEEFYNGSAGWKLVADGDNQGVIQKSNKAWSAVAGRKYRIRFHVRKKSGSSNTSTWFQGEVIGVDANGNTVYMTSESSNVWSGGHRLTTEDTWVRYDLVFLCPTDGDYRVKISNGGAYSQGGSHTTTYYIDGIYASEYGENYDIEYLKVKQVFSQPAYFLPKGITLRISKRDTAGRVEYFSDYINPVDLDPTNHSLDHEIDLGFLPIKWSNCYSFGNGVESNRIRDDYNARTIDKGPRVSTTLRTNYEEETKKSSLIYSGIYNGISNVNKLNEFIAAEKITKDLNPEYGSIQKLFTRNTNVIAFCEDKILKILSNKDALYNADGNPQLLASNRVLGQSVPFTGEYGISTNPESFASYGYRVYFTDKNRGAVLRLSADGLTPISDKGMKNYFRTKFSLANNIIGSYNEDKDVYNLTIDDETVSFTETVNGWTSFKSFLPEDGISLNGTYYTFKNGDIWKHHVNSIRNNFYNTQYDSSIKFVFNDSPSAIKNFNTLNYEGTTSRVYEGDVGQENLIIKRGWYTDSVESELQSGEVTHFKDKEGKWFNNITGVEVEDNNIDPKEFTSQGLGFGTNISLGGHPIYKPLKINALTPSSSPEVDFLNATSGIYLGSATNNARYGGIANIPANTTYTEDVPNTTTGWTVTSPNSLAFDRHSQGSPPTTTNPNAWYLIDGILGLVEGNDYLVTADVEFTYFHGSVGFSHVNMTRVAPTKTLEGRTPSYISAGVPSGSKAKFSISTEFKYIKHQNVGARPPLPNSGINEFKGITIFKNSYSSGFITNIQAYNITPAITTDKYIVNTSLTDKSVSTTRLESNHVVDGTENITKYWYIHGNSVNGIKWAVEAANFSAELPLSNTKYTTTLSDLGSVGYYANIIQVEVTIYYNSAEGKFPVKGDDLQLIIEGETNMAIDQ